MPLEQNLLSLIPIANSHSTLQIRPTLAIQVLKNAILILQPAIYPFRSGISILDGSQATSLSYTKATSIIIPPLQY